MPRRRLRLAHEWKLIDRVPRIRLWRGERNREYVPPHSLEATYQPVVEVAWAAFGAPRRQNPLGAAQTADPEEARARLSSDRWSAAFRRSS